MSEFTPTDVAVPRQVSPEAAPSDSPDASFDEGRDASVPARERDASVPAREREGLPTAYRMRADSHYVDQLAGRRSDRATAPDPTRLAPRPTERASDSRTETRREAHDPRRERLLAELARTMSTIGSAATLLSDDPSVMARHVSIDLIRAEAWRAGWMLRAQAILGGSHRGGRRPHDLAAVLAQVADGFSAEGRLKGVALELRGPVRGAVASFDEAAVIAGVGGAVIWALGHVGQAGGSVIALSGEVVGGQLETIEVSEESPARGTDQARRPSGARSTDDEWLAALGASTAKAVAELHHGDAAFLAGDGGRSSVRFTFRTGNSLRS